MPSLHRPRVLSLNFFNRDNNAPSSNEQAGTSRIASANYPTRDVPTKEPSSPVAGDIAPTHTLPTTRTGWSESRPSSMVSPYAPPMMNVDHIEELLPVFSFLSSHGNKLYQEGYFLKLNDLDTTGKPNNDRNWTECFAQLVGTVLSLWDAAALDAAGQDGEVAPTFVNLADASIKMIETLPTRNQDVQPLQNVLSISTAGKNRYLLHFNSLHSLTQWTAGIRLSMFEHASLQELYTGSLIAGKGKHLNNIRTIMERSKFRTEDWARVRFGAGTPWRRCWCVIEPPDEREFQRQHKSLKKRSAYERPSYPKGDIKFYDSKKTKKAVPIATITDAYSAYAIYPQSKPLIDQSTLVKVEGKITIHSKPESKTEGFVFVMPEVHPAVSGFEIMLRWLFPVYDSFHLYGRPNRLVADTLDPRGLMFAMPKERRYGYLDIIDVAGLIHTDGSEKWTEREWRKQMKEITARRMQMATQPGISNTFPRNNRLSMGSRNGARYDDNVSIRSTPSTRHLQNQSTDAVFATTQKADIAPPGGPFPVANYHARSVSESVTIRSPSSSKKQQDGYINSRLPMDREGTEQFPIVAPPPPPAIRQPYHNGRQNGFESMDSHNSSDSDLQGGPTNPEEINRELRESTPPTPVVAPPSFQHEAGDRPRTRPNAMPDLRREKSRMSTATLAQMTEASKMTGAAATAATAAWKSREGMAGGDSTPRGVNETPSDSNRKPANETLSHKGMVAGAPTELNPPKRPDTESRESSGHSITRKPLPRSSSEQSVTRRTAPAQAVPPIPITQPAANQSGPIYSKYQAMGNAVLAANSSPAGASGYSNPFDDHSSTDSPDYASTVKSTDTKGSDQSVVRPRAGALKTVGSSQIAKTVLPSDIPPVDFGPTKRLTPDSSRPATPGGLPTGRKSPFETTPTDSLTPEKRLSRTISTPPSAERPGMQVRSSSYADRTLAWQPGLIATGRQSPGLTLTPDQFVQQRAAAARMPTGYAPRRNQSFGNIDRPTSALAKRDSYNAPQSRNTPSPTMMQQMQQMQQQDYSARLSAREQEHVARMTGAPLVNVARRSWTPDPSVGLIGAIEAREQEKRNIKEGVSGQMVQAAIAQRQQHGQVNMHAQQAAQMAYGGSQGQRLQYGGGNQAQQQQYPTAQYPDHDTYGRQNPQSQYYGQQDMGYYGTGMAQPGQQMQNQWHQQQAQGQWQQQQPQPVYAEYYAPNQQRQQDRYGR